MKKLVNFLPLLAAICIFSCSSPAKGISDSSRRVLDKTYDQGAVPASFNKSTAGVLIVQSDFRRKNYRKYLGEIATNIYKGQSVLVTAKQKLDVLYPDVNKYRYILVESGIEAIRHSSSNYNNAYGTLTVSYNIYDRLEKKTYPDFFRENRNWKMSAAYAFEKLNAKL